MKVHNPTTPKLSFSHGVELEGQARLLFVAGQTGLTEGGDVPDGIEAQTALAFKNIGAVLASAGMSFGNIVKTTVYLTDRDAFHGYARARAAAFGNLKPAATLVIVKELLDPRHVVEIDVVAAEDRL